MSAIHGCLLTTTTPDGHTVTLFVPDSSSGGGGSDCLVVTAREGSQEAQETNVNNNNSNSVPHASTAANNGDAQEWTNALRRGDSNRRLHELPRREQVSSPCAPVPPTAQSGQHDCDNNATLATAVVVTPPRPSFMQQSKKDELPQQHQQDSSNGHRQPSTVSSHDSLAPISATRHGQPWQPPWPFVPPPASTTSGPTAANAQQRRRGDRRPSNRGGAGGSTAWETKRAANPAVAGAAPYSANAAHGARTRAPPALMLPPPPAAAAPSSSHPPPMRQYASYEHGSDLGGAVRGATNKKAAATMMTLPTRTTALPEPVAVADGPAVFPKQEQQPQQQHPLHATWLAAAPAVPSQALFAPYGPNVGANSFLFHPLPQQSYYCQQHPYHREASDNDAGQIALLSFGSTTMSALSPPPQQHHSMMTVWRPTAAVDTAATMQSVHSVQPPQQPPVLVPWPFHASAAPFDASQTMMLAPGPFRHSASSADAAAATTNNNNLTFPADATTTTAESGDAAHGDFALSSYTVTGDDATALHDGRGATNSAPSTAINTAPPCDANNHPSSSCHLMSENDPAPAAAGGRMLVLPPPASRPPVMANGPTTIQLPPNFMLLSAPPIAPPGVPYVQHHTLYYAAPPLSMTTMDSSEGSSMTANNSYRALLIDDDDDDDPTALSEDNDSWCASVDQPAQPTHPVGAAAASIAMPSVVVGRAAVPRGGSAHRPPHSVPPSAESVALSQQPISRAASQDVRRGRAMVRALCREASDEVIADRVAKAPADDVVAMAAALRAFPTIALHLCAKQRGRLIHAVLQHAGATHGGFIVRLVCDHFEELAFQSVGCVAIIRIATAAATLVHATRNNTTTLLAPVDATSRPHHSSPPSSSSSRDTTSSSLAVGPYVPSSSRDTTSSSLAAGPYVSSSFTLLDVLFDRVAACAARLALHPYGNFVFSHFASVAGRDDYVQRLASALVTPRQENHHHRVAPSQAIVGGAPRPPDDDRTTDINLGGDPGFIHRAVEKHGAFAVDALLKHGSFHALAGVYRALFLSNGERLRRLCRHPTAHFTVQAALSSMARQVVVALSGDAPLRADGVVAMMFECFRDCLVACDRATTDSPYRLDIQRRAAELVEAMNGADTIV